MPRHPPDDHVEIPCDGPFELHLIREHGRLKLSIVRRYDGEATDRRTVRVREGYEADVARFAFPRPDPQLPPADPTPDPEDDPDEELTPVDGIARSSPRHRTSG